MIGAKLLVAGNADLLVQLIVKILPFTFRVDESLVS